MSAFMRNLLDMVSRIPLVEDESHRKQALARVDSQQHPLMIHVILLTALAADDGLRNHWQSECLNFISCFDEDQLKAGSLSRYDYWHNLYAGPLEP